MRTHLVPVQVLFLLYHYYNAKEIYNAIRVFVAAYVWMTGFGKPLAKGVGVVGCSAALGSSWVGGHGVRHDVCGRCCGLGAV